MAPAQARRIPACTRSFRESLSSRKTGPPFAGPDVDGHSGERNDADRPEGIAHTWTARIGPVAFEKNHHEEPQPMSPEHLDRPPIVEVVCGVTFSPVAGLDPVSTGVYWSTRRERFPTYQLQPALSESEEVAFLPVPPLRVWLISADDQFILQVQADRLYLNWRKRAEQYPRFNDHGGREGLLTRTLSEFEALSEFCAGHLGGKPQPTGIELSKIDLLREGEHWTKFSDLAALLPWLDPVAGFSRTEDPKLQLRFQETRSSGTLTIVAAMGIEQTTPAASRRILSLESRYSAKIGGNAVSIKSAFTEGNAELNRVFETLIPKEKVDLLFRQVQR